MLAELSAQMGLRFTYEQGMQMKINEGECLTGRGGKKGCRSGCESRGGARNETLEKDMLSVCACRERFIRCDGMIWCCIHRRCC